MALPPEKTGPSTKKAERDAATQDVFLQEVDDALREDQIRTLWERYGKAGIAALVLIIAGLLGWMLWENQKQSAAETQGEAYVKALDTLEAGNLDGALAALSPIENAEQDGYRAAARLLKGGILQEKGDSKGAIAAFAAVAKDEAVAKPYRDLALIRQSTLEFDSVKPQVIVDRLKPLAVPGNAWFGSAGELVGIAYMRMGKNDLAGPLFAQIAKDKKVPATLRSRAQQLAGLMGVDAVEDPEQAARGQDIPVDRP